MSGPIWMPLYIGDYMADTIGLTKSEHGSYLLSMMAYWKKGESLTSKELNAVCGRDVDRVSQFYIWCESRWHHKRIDAELRKANDKMNAAQAKARKMVEGRRKLGQLQTKHVKGEYDL